MTSNKNRIRGLTIFLCCLVSSSNAVGEEISRLPEKQAHDSCRVPSNPAFQTYLDSIEKNCNENRTYYLPLSKRVVVHCFLMDNGVLRDPKITVSSGNLIEDMSCIDAVLCSSPVPPPPPRCPYGIPGITNITGIMLLDALPAGPIEVRFKATTHKGQTQERLKVPLIPIEVSKRFPGSFSDSELREESNYLELASSNLAPAILASFRYPWTEFFLSRKTATKEEILERLDVIQKFFSPVVSPQ